MNVPVADMLTLERALDAPYLPGFQRGEQVIAKAWLGLEGHPDDLYGFNVRIGEGVTPPESAPDYAKRFVTKTTQKRIDIVRLRAGAVSLWEVKIQANLGALGQMQGYCHLWNRQFPAWTCREFGILCHLISADTAAVYLAHKMPFFLFADIVLPPLDILPAPG